MTNFNTIETDLPSPTLPESDNRIRMIDASGILANALIPMPMTERMQDFAVSSLHVLQTSDLAVLQGKQLVAGIKTVRLVVVVHIICVLVFQVVRSHGTLEQLGNILCLCRMRPSVVHERCGRTGMLITSNCIGYDVPNSDNEYFLPLYSRKTCDAQLSFRMHETRFNGLPAQNITRDISQCLDLLVATFTISHPK